MIGIMMKFLPLILLLIIIAVMFYFVSLKKNKVESAEGTTSTVMDDHWEIYANSIDGHNAWVSYDHGYSKLIDQDPRNYVLKVYIHLKEFTEDGMPTGNEFGILNNLEDSLVHAISAVNGIHYGRLTFNKKRNFYFYVENQTNDLESIVENVCNEFNRDFEVSFEFDPEKEWYWKGIYPNADSWQVVQDLKVLNALTQNGDNPSIEREVFHWAYFEQESNAQNFAEWLSSQGYSVSSTNIENKNYQVRFSHIGSMILPEITRHTVTLNRQARSMNGDYDGWETSVEKQN